MLFTNILIYILCFFLIWVAAGLIVKTVSKFSQRLKLSSFAVSFIVLGILTSTPEFAVGLQAIADQDPEIFVGNLLGGVVAIFLFIIPILAVFGNGINLKNNLDKKTMIVTLGVIGAPALLVLDRRVSNPEGIVLILLYVVLLLLIQKKKGFLDRQNSQVLNTKLYSYRDVLKLLLGIGVIFITSNLIVEKTIYFSEYFGVSAFVISLIVLSLGTNMPEISLAVRSVLRGQKDVAFGDYMGSAAANTFLFGLFTILNNGDVLTISNFLGTFLFIIIGLGMFYFFSRSKNAISRNEGIVLFTVYISFVIYEFFLR